MPLLLATKILVGFYRLIIIVLLIHGHIHICPGSCSGTCIHVQVNIVHLHVGYFTPNQALSDLVKSFGPQSHRLS